MCYYIRMEKTENKNRIALWLGLCPKRHVLLAVFTALIVLFRLLRGNRSVMNAVWERLVHPYQIHAARLCSRLPFSVMELIYVLAILGGLVYIIYQSCGIIRKPDKLKRVYITAVTLAVTGLGIFAALSWAFSVSYYADSFSEKSGLAGNPVSEAELIEVTEFFAARVNEYGALVSRDGNGLFTCSEAELFVKNEYIYDSIAEEFPCLQSVYIKTKPMFFSRIMSMTGFTGVFFPFTGEANVNVDSPLSHRAATIAHEMAHQRGVASEAEANFVAVAACMSSGDADFCYSGALLAYTHLANALYGADYDAWLAVAESLSDDVRRDLAFNRAYWQKYESPLSKVTEGAYDGYLRSNGFDGLRSYGACVDLLVAYYSDKI
ncbi:MAG: DUF3810 domain-containing protein [Oscillospiraceae bacterium]|nr:DUF3810 domain-containing protein [Oscillospiraceae bacterium]